MEAVVLVMCLVVVFVAISGLHLYTMRKISNVQKNTTYGSKDWKELEKASAGSLYTMLMLFFFSVLIAIPIAGVTKMYLLAMFIGGVWYES